MDGEDVFAGQDPVLHEVSQGIVGIEFMKFLLLQDEELLVNGRPENKPG